MPKVTVYIRNEDYESWKNVAEKTQFMHDALRTGMTTIPPRDAPTRAAEKPYAELPIAETGKLQKRVDEIWNGPLFRDKKNKKL